MHDATRILETRVPARLDRLPWGRFHTLVVAALGITWVLDALEVTLAGSIAGALEASPRLRFTASDIGLASTFYLAGAVTGAQRIPGIKHVIAVASGKGGVGKSTVAANLAVALEQTKARVGLCDCDIYGPSISLMFGTRERPTATEENKIIPIEQYHLKLMSMGFLLDDTSPAILRGPMVTRYTQQFLRQVDWGELDFLILDLPPGTGDIQLTIVQTVALSGAVIVTTPQEVALIDARKAATMFEKVNVPVLGLIENMSYFVSPSDQKRYDIFGSGGGEREAKRLRVPLLGQIPIDIATREAGDRGEPIVSRDRQSPVAKEFTRVAQRVREALA